MRMLSFNLFCRALEIVSMAFDCARRAVRATIFVVEEDGLTDVVQANRDADLFQHTIQIQDSTCPGHPVIVTVTDVLFQPLVEPFLESKINAVNDNGLTVMRHISPLMNVG
jgi:hypothetical protein